MKETKAALQWRYQRILSLALIPLTILFLYLLNSSLPTNNTETILQVLQNMCIQNPLIMLLISTIVIIHVKMGAQEIIEDYVHTEKTKLVCLIFVNILSVRIITDTFIYLYI